MHLKHSFVLLFYKMLSSSLVTSTVTSTIKIPNDILLKIIGLAHLTWVQDNLKIETEVFELTNLTWDMWDICEEFCGTFYRRELKELKYKITNLG